MTAVGALAVAEPGGVQQRPPPEDVDRQRAAEQAAWEAIEQAQPPFTPGLAPPAAILDGDPTQGLDEELTLNQPRHRGTHSLDTMPRSSDRLGDRLAWFYDHEEVKKVVRGRVVAAQGVFIGTVPTVETRCEMEVLENLKGTRAKW
jgi:hypothetical protein